MGLTGRGGDLASLWGSMQPKPKQTCSLYLSVMFYCLIRRANIGNVPASDWFITNPNILGPVPNPNVTEQNPIIILRTSPLNGHASKMCDSPAVDGNVLLL